MDAEPSVLRSGRRWRRRPPPPSRSRGPKHPAAAPHPDREAPSGSASPRDAAALFSCSVCLGTARQPVVTHCGHLFCWPCLFRWVRRQGPGGGGGGGCPVCESRVAIEPDDGAGVTPIYGIGRGRDPARDGGGGDGEDGISLEVPPRPRGVWRPEQYAGGGSWPQGTSRGDELVAFREALNELSRDVDALEERMLQVMALVAQLRVLLLSAYAQQIAGQDDSVGAPLAERRRIGEVLGLQGDGSDGGGDGVYRGTRSRRRQTNLDGGSQHS